MGGDFNGELGDGIYSTNAPYGTNCPEQIVSSNVTTMSAGDHTLFLKNDGSLWAMGDNYAGELGDNSTGELGDGTFNNANQPELIVASNVTSIAAGYSYSLFLKSDGSLWGMGENGYGQLGDSTYNNTSQPEQILAAYNQIHCQLLRGINMQLSFVGIAGTHYALDRSFGLSPPNWIPQSTNPANSFGALVFTNTPDPTTNNFWRIRSVAP